MRNKQKKGKRKRSNNIGWSSDFLRRMIKKIWSTLLWVGARLLLISFATFLTSVIYFYFIIPPFDALLDGRRKGSVTFLDKNNETFAWRGQQFDRTLRSTNASPSLLNAIISSEDKNFYQHYGFSISGILGAIKINLQEGRGPLKGHGGSTVTQQLAKLLCLLKNNTVEAQCRQQSIARKILEIPFSIALEIKFSKSEILSIYMNRVYLGAGAIGFEAASQRYFGKSAMDVTLAESSMLVALLKAPSKYAPTNNLKLAQQRARLVINSMLKQKYISELQAELAINNPATLSKNAKMDVGTHFADWIMHDAPDLLTVKTTEDIVIRTTFDPIIQKQVEKSVRNVFASKVRQNSKAEAAVVVMSASGDVLAMLGGRKNTELQGQYNRAFQAFRQPGSAFKPFVYAAALEKGYSPDYLLDDNQEPPSTMVRLNYWPKNYNNKYSGKTTMREGLVNSVNTVTVQLAHEVGLQNIIDLARRLGIKSTLSPNLSLALGSSEVSLLQLTSAYAGFLSLGHKVYPRGWLDLRLKSSNEILIRSMNKKNKRVIDASVAKALTTMLVSTVENGTGKLARVNGWQVAGKTGTSQNARDAWFIGFTSEYVVGVWMGTDDNTPLEGVVGGNLPSIIWSEIIKKIHDKPPNRFPSLSTDEYEKLLNGILVKKQLSLGRYKETIEKTYFFEQLIDFFKNFSE